MDQERIQDLLHESTVELCRRQSLNYCDAMRKVRGEYLNEKRLDEAEGLAKNQKTDQESVEVEMDRLSEAVSKIKGVDHNLVIRYFGKVMQEGGNPWVILRKYSEASELKAYMENTEPGAAAVLTKTSPGSGRRTLKVY